MKAATTLLLALQLLLITASADAVDIIGRVVAVADGDTITVLDSTHVQYKIRIAGIDAPEKGQPFGNRSKQHLSDLVFGKDVRVDWYKHDPYGRTVGNVWVIPPDSPCQKPTCPKTLDAGLAQITVGLAWHYKLYADEQSEQDRHRYDFAEQEARAKEAGLWSDPNPVAPWQWRRSPSPETPDTKPPDR